MNNGKINELLKTLSSLHPKKWKNGLACSTNVNKIDIRIQGSSEYGSNYYIEVGGTRVYKREEKLFSLNIKRSQIDKQLDDICGNIRRYYETHQHSEAMNKIEKILK